MKNMSIAAILQKYREEAHYTKHDLAQYFDVDASLITDWESGSTEPTISECLILSKLYGIPLDDMFADFDVYSVVPETCKENFECKRRINSGANRWYN